MDENEELFRRGEDNCSLCFGFPISISQEQLSSPLNYYQVSTHNTHTICYNLALSKIMVAVAQLVRAPLCGRGGQGFESLLPPQV